MRRHETSGLFGFFYRFIFGGGEWGGGHPNLYKRLRLNNLKGQVGVANGGEGESIMRVYEGSTAGIEEVLKGQVGAGGPVP